MKSFLNKNIATAFLVVTVVAIGTSQAAIVPLGTTAADFAVLGSSTVTNTGNTIINGDVGLYSGPSITGFAIPPTNTVVEGPGSTGLTNGPGIVHGTIYISHSVAQTAQSQVLATYDSLTGLTATVDLTGNDLGGLTLTAGVYDFASSAALTGTLTLSGTGDFVFRIGSTLDTATGAKVLASSGANVYWQVGSSATLLGGTDFVGNILAHTSITLNGGTLDGRALAMGGEVKISDAETINVPTTVPEPATMCLLGFGALNMLRRRRKFLPMK